MSSYNSSGERLYLDADGAKCNLRGMMKREPAWVLSRFARMEIAIEQLRNLLKMAQGDANNPHACYASGCPQCALLRAISAALAGGEV